MFEQWKPDQHMNLSSLSCQYLYSMNLQKSLKTEHL